MIDTHAHLDALDDPESAVERARAAGVARIVTVGTTVESCRRSIELAERHEGVFAVLGLHPHEAGSVGDADVSELRRLLEHERAVGVGETGLDYFRDYAPRDAQRRLFARLLELAAELDKPAVIHTRAADTDTAAALVSFPGRVVLHCFSSPHLAQPARDHGWYVSFAGNVSYPKAVDLRLAARTVAGNRLLAETDSPYLAPQPVRGKPNEPANVVHTLAALAAARGEDVGELETRIDRNASACFALA